MSSKQAASLAFKLTGMVCSIMTVPFFHTTLIAILTVGLERTPFNLGAFVALQVAPFVVLLFAGVLLFLRSDALAERYFPGTRPTSEVAAVDDLQAIAISVLGLWVLAFALPDIARVGTHLVVPPDARSPEEVGLGALFEAPLSKYARDTWGYAGAALMQIAIGGALFLRSRAIVRWWKHLNADQDSITD